MRRRGAARRPCRDRSLSASAHPHVWVTMRSELDLRPGRLGHRRASCLDLRRHVLGVRDPGHRQQDARRSSPARSCSRWPRPTSSRSRTSTISPCAKVERQEGRLRRSAAADYYLDYKDRDPDAALHAAVQGAGEGARSCRSRSTIRPISSTSPSRRRIAVALVGAPAGLQADDAAVRRRWTPRWRSEARSSCAPTPSSIPSALPRRAVRQQDPGEMFREPYGRNMGRTTRQLVDRRHRDRRAPAGGRRDRCRAGAGPPFGVAAERAPAGAAVRPASSAGSWSSRPSSIKVLSGAIRAAKTDGSAALGAARRVVPLRHLPRRRPRPRQGGDLVLRGRQRRDLVARRRALLRVGAGAGAGRGRCSWASPRCS